MKEKKEEIIRKKSGLAERRIYIDHDFTKREREVQRGLAEVLRKIPKNMDRRGVDKVAKLGKNKENTNF